MRNLLILIALALASWFSSGLDAAERQHRGDHDDVRASVSAGERLSLSRILAQVERTHGGRVLEIESDRENGRDIYEIELLEENGRVIELEIDAITGEVLDSEYED